MNSVPWGMGGRSGLSGIARRRRTLRESWVCTGSARSGCKGITDRVKPCRSLSGRSMARCREAGPQRMARNPSPGGRCRALSTSPSGRGGHRLDRRGLSLLSTATERAHAPDSAAHDRHRHLAPVQGERRPGACRRAAAVGARQGQARLHRQARRRRRRAAGVRGAARRGARHQGPHARPSRPLPRGIRGEGPGVGRRGAFRPHRRRRRARSSCRSAARPAPAPSPRASR